ncbi:MAG: hypothetical protein JNM79_00030 [Burkholderiales bacterium]|nr:hypothetical protein [Burkholderiales bacterium]
MATGDDDLLRTTRLGTLRGAHPAYIAGQMVFLQRDLQGYAKAATAKVLSVQPGRPGEHRYQLLIGNDKFWAYEADLRPTPPGAPPLATEPGGGLSITQRLQSMSLSQRMATLGVDETRRLNDLASTQPMHALTQEERMAELLKTNRIKTLGGGLPTAPGKAGGDSGQS